MNGVYFSGGGGLISTPEDYLQFGLMLGERRPVEWQAPPRPRTVEMMESVAAPDTLPGRPREAYGLSVRVVNDPMARNTFLSEGSFGWSGSFGTLFWVDRKENLVAIVMTQTSNQDFLRDFETMVMQAVVGGGRSRRDELRPAGRLRDTCQHRSRRCDLQRLRRRRRRAARSYRCCLHVRRRDRESARDAVLRTASPAPDSHSPQPLPHQCGDTRAEQQQGRWAQGQRWPNLAHCLEALKPVTNPPPP